MYAVNPEQLVIDPIAHVEVLDQVLVERRPRSRPSERALLEERRAAFAQLAAESELYERPSLRRSLAALDPPRL